MNVLIDGVMIVFLGLIREIWIIFQMDIHYGQGVLPKQIHVFVSQNMYQTGVYCSCS